MAKAKTTPRPAHSWEPHNPASLDKIRGPVEVTYLAKEPVVRPQATAQEVELRMRTINTRALVLFRQCSTVVCFAMDRDGTWRAWEGYPSAVLSQRWFGPEKSYALPPGLLPEFPGSYLGSRLRVTDYPAKVVSDSFAED